MFDNVRAERKTLDVIENWQKLDTTLCKIEQIPGGLDWAVLPSRKIEPPCSKMIINIQVCTVQADKGL